MLTKLICHQKIRSCRGNECLFCFVDFTVAYESDVKGRFMANTIKARIGDAESMGGRIHRGNAGSDICESCVHLWSEHRLCAISRPPTEGWIECPADGCECHRTWSMPADTAEQVRQMHQSEE